MGAALGATFSLYLVGSRYALIGAILGVSIAVPLENLLPFAVWFIMKTASLLILILLFHQADRECRGSKLNP